MSRHEGKFLPTPDPLTLASRETPPLLAESHAYQLLVREQRVIGRRRLLLEDI